MLIFFEEFYISGILLTQRKRIFPFQLKFSKFENFSPFSTPYSFCMFHGRLRLNLVQVHFNDKLTIFSNSTLGCDAMIYFNKLEDFSISPFCDYISIESWFAKKKNTLSYVGLRQVHSVLVYKKRCKSPTSAVSYFFSNFNQFLFLNFL